MRAKSEVEVTLSDDLLDHLYRLSHKSDIPLRWLVAGLVCDTIRDAPSRRGEAATSKCQSLACLTWTRCQASGGT